MSHLRRRVQLWQTHCDCVGTDRFGEVKMIFACLTTKY